MAGLLPLPRGFSPCPMGFPPLRGGIPPRRGGFPGRATGMAPWVRGFLPGPAGMARGRKGCPPRRRGLFRREKGFLSLKTSFTRRSTPPFAAEFSVRNQPNQTKGDTNKMANQPYFPNRIGDRIMWLKKLPQQTAQLPGRARLLGRRHRRHPGRCRLHHLPLRDLAPGHPHLCPERLGLSPPGPRRLGRDHRSAGVCPARAPGRAGGGRVRGAPAHFRVRQKPQDPRRLHRVDGRRSRHHRGRERG